MDQETESNPTKWEFFETLKRYESFDWDDPNTSSFFPIAESNPNGRYLIIKSQSKDFDLDTVHPFKLRKFLENQFPGYSELVKLRQGGFMLKTKTSKQALDAIQSLDEIPEHGKISVSSVKNLNEVRGVIFGKELLYLTDEELKAAMAEYNVVSIRRMKRTVNGRSDFSGTFVIAFDINTLPKNIKVINFSYNVRPFIPGPFQCFKCLSFGHPTAKCSSEKEYCPKCGAEKSEDHVCGAMKCKNCPSGKNDHSPTSPNCPEYLFEKIVQRKRVQQKLSYSKAKADILHVCDTAIRKNKESYSCVLASDEREIITKTKQIDEKIQTRTLMNKMIENKLAKYDELIKHYQSLIKQQKEREAQLYEIENVAIQNGLVSANEAKKLREDVIGEEIEIDDDFSDDENIFEYKGPDMEVESEECNIANDPPGQSPLKKIKVGNNNVAPRNSFSTTGSSNNHTNQGTRCSQRLLSRNEKSKTQVDVNLGRDKNL